MKLVKSLQKTLKPFTKMVKKSNKLMLLLGVLLLLGLILLVKMYMKKREGFNESFTVLKNIHFTYNRYDGYYESGNTGDNKSTAAQVKSALMWCKDKDNIQYPTSNSSIDFTYSTNNLTYVIVGFVKFNGTADTNVTLELQSDDEGHLFIIEEDSKEGNVNVYDTSISPPIVDNQIEAMVDTGHDTDSKTGKYHIINDGGLHGMSSKTNSYTFKSGKIYKIIVYSGNSGGNGGFKLSVSNDHINKFSDASSFIDGTLIKKLYRGFNFNKDISKLYDAGRPEICLVDKINTVDYGSDKFTEVFMGYMKLKNSYDASTKIRFALKGDDNIFLYIIPEDTSLYNNIFIGEYIDDIEDINILHKNINDETKNDIFSLEYLYNNGDGLKWKSGDYELDPGKKYKIIIYFEDTERGQEIRFLAGLPIPDNINNIKPLLPYYELSGDRKQLISNLGGFDQDSVYYKNFSDFKNTNFPLEFISINKGRNVISQNNVKTKLKDGLGIELTDTNTVNSVVGKAKTKYEGLQTVLKNQGFMYRPAPAPTPSPTPPSPTPAPTPAPTPSPTPSPN